jgi:putative hydrolase of HD superfamily
VKPDPHWLPRLAPLLALGTLPRTGWVLHGVPVPETIAAHSAGVAQLVLLLGERVEPALALERAVALAVVHDLAEARTGDLPRRAAAALPPGAKAAMEEAAARELLEGLAPRALALWREQQAGASREARFVKLCDRLQLGLRLVGYARAGVRGLDELRAVVDELECGEFAPCRELRAELVRELDALGLRSG